MTRWTHGLINRLVLICDLTFIMLSTVLAHALWGIATSAQMLLLYGLGVLIYGEMLRLGVAYRVEHYIRFWRQMRHLLAGGIPAAAAVTAAYWIFIPPEARDLGGVIKWGALTLAALIFGRAVIVRAGVKLAQRNAVLRRNMVLIGSPQQVREFLARSGDGDKSLFDVLGCFCDEQDDDCGTAVGAFPFLGPTENLVAYARDNPVDVIVILESWKRLDELESIIQRVRPLAADVYVPLNPDELNLRYAQITSVVGVSALLVQRQPLKGSLGVLKTAEDYIVAMLGFIVSLPVLIIAAIAIKLDSPGPILFLQDRVGFNNRLFKVYKLRTMTVDPVDDGSGGTLRNDPRITKVGAILRRTSVDELPQLINVLKGDMSVVGPRPHVQNMQIGTRTQYDVVKEYAARYRMKPGITGWAQINGMRGGIHTVEKASRGAKLDLFYIENWSLWLDIKIMLLTVTKGLAGRDVF